MSAKFDQLETLRRAAWEKIESRRKYEWKVSIAFWGLGASFIAILLNDKVDIKGPGGMFLIALPILLCVAHCLWLRGMFRAYTIDKTDEESFRVAMHSEAGLTEKDDWTKDARAKLRKDREKGALRNWNTQAELLATVALGILAIYMVAWKTLMR